MNRTDLNALAELLAPLIMDRLRQEKPWREELFFPSMDLHQVPPEHPFMRFSTCSSRDFLHPEFTRIMEMLKIERAWHRKAWEWAFIVHHALASGHVRQGSRGLVFGVGVERLPALFASLGAFITATDAPSEIDLRDGWRTTNEYAASLDSLESLDLDRATFERQVEWRTCDMNNISPDLTGYDFCWSACCFEHLGGLRPGIDFVINSVEKTLKVGGVAVHTTEFNLSSNVDTIDQGSLVIYRLRDMEQLVEELRARGHEVQPFRVAPDSVVIDGFVDTPPYGASHLKLRIENYVTTSAGIVVRRGR